jgi:16S rRNA G966 N2-methylase RsmD
MIKNTLDNISDFVPKARGNVFTYTNNLYTFEPKTATKYRLPSVKVPKHIEEKCKKHYVGDADNFHTLLLCILLRYDSLGSGANQFAVDLEYKDQLRNNYGTNFECFASVINRYYDNFCSMFYDLERDFGSKGSFMALDIKQGFYMANPPYDENLLAKMYQQVKKALSSNLPVAFIMSIPKWTDFALQKEIELDAIYDAEQIKHEYFHNPMSTDEKVLIPEYISYLFFNDAYRTVADTGSVRKTFLSFNNKPSRVTDDSPFPYRNELYSDKDKLNIFKSLKEVNLKRYRTDKKPQYRNINISFVDYLMDGQYSYILFDPSDEISYLTSDMFNDVCRVQCSFGTYPTPLAYYQNNKDVIIKRTGDRAGNVTPLEIREQIYHDATECSTHNPLIIKHYINHYHATKVLDPSAGWGDRLIGSMAAGVSRYLGVDPNSCTYPGYQRMIELYGNNGNYRVIKDGFQNVELADDDMFDLVYTSPPYFDYEVYSEDTAQSINEFKGEKQWLEKFIYPTITTCIKHLVPNGHLVLYFSQQSGKTYMEKFLEWMLMRKGMYFMGSNMYATIGRMKQPHPIFVYKKSITIPVQLYNPPMIVSPIEYNGKTLHIFRDDCVIGGTKNRAAIDYITKILLDKPDTNELVYLGASNGYAQVAFANALRLLKSTIKMTLFFQQTKNRDAQQLIILARYLYPHMNYRVFNGSFKDNWPKYDKYLLEHPLAYEIPFGLHDETFTMYLRNALLPRLEPYIDKVKTMWMVAGSGTLYKVISSILTKTEFHVVQVGKQVQLSGNVTIHVSSLSLYQVHNTRIPFPTTESYDGKIWEFADKFHSGDYIWNTAGVHMKI